MAAQGGYGVKKRHVILLIVFVVIAGIILAAVLIKSSLEKNLKQLVNLPIADVDSVSGASYSSKVILKAIEDALASGDIR